MTAPTTSLDLERAARRAFRAPDVIAAANITHRMLDYWTRTGLVTASGTPNQHGSGDVRWYHENDVLRVAVIKALLDAGLSLATIRTHLDQVLVDGTLSTAYVTIRIDLAAVRTRLADYRRVAS